MIKDNYKKIPIPIITIILILVLVSIINPFVIIPSGFVGIKRTLGKIEDTPLREGLHVIVPLLQRVEKLEIKTRTVEFTRERQNPINSLSKDGLPVNMDVAVLYKVEPSRAPRLIKEYSFDYEERIIKQIVRTAVRDAVAEMESSIVYQERQRLQDKIRREVAKYLTWRFLENTQEYAKSQNNAIILIPYN